MPYSTQVIFQLPFGFEFSTSVTTAYALYGTSLLLGLTLLALAMFPISSKHNHDAVQ